MSFFSSVFGCRKQHKKGFQKTQKTLTHLHLLSRLASSLNDITSAPAIGAQVSSVRMFLTVGVDLPWT